MYDSTIFNRYINEIGDPKIQEIVEECLQKCPKEFYTMPASTTGKYHPPFALGEGGLVRHTLAACCWAKDIAVRAIFHFIAKSRLYSSRFDFA